MKQNNFMRRYGLCAMLLACIATFTVTSCVQDDYDENEKWQSSVRNTQLVAPDVDSITVTSSADGSQQTISWPLVMGAGGYKLTLYNTADTVNALVKDTIIDGTSMIVDREDDSNYELRLQVVENTKMNNAASEEVTKYFSTFVPATAVAPSGTDLYTYNEIIAAYDDTEYVLELEAGGQYTLSGLLDFSDKTVTLRSAEKTQPATVTFTGGDAGLATQAPMTVKYVDFDASASNAPFLAYTETPTVATTDKGSYYINGTIAVISCNIEGLNSMFFYNNKQNFATDAFLVDQCTVHFTTTSTGDANGSGNSYFNFYNTGGLVQSFTLQNSTFYNTGEGAPQYFLRYNNSARWDRVNSEWANSSINYISNTFYNIAPSGQWGNYSALAGRSDAYWTMTYNIFVGCSNEIARRFLAGRGNQSTATFGYNTYQRADGTYDDAVTSGYDNSGTIIEEDPGFADPENGDFTLSNATHIRYKCGAPRWIPED